MWWCVGMFCVFDVVFYVGWNVSDCGYCVLFDVFVSDGVVVYGLLMKRYGELIDDGWRCSGMWIYKFVIDVLCCV